ncbi:serine phosphatase RsbU (regulator of sigma subunit) [Algoriphagus ratkowskyi]|uniref:Serine phosphatase RsbU (Regulator of sigma subunit) n=1 Tax=Algoriphagus ratkowskyi TaxID=57028 RepID=A0A2W7T983_9BACT|nr:SpoIIE family protein phosphatase [Algoriphagus ratkowskyi]PZX59712.1 serine phosphatase RsbU (regulator of sigma subunit) [Algoriphagus ratkowskyi]TXD78572.1 SpoIIE family protein phosphatase [Algoriphagus ratkowskyi]
MIKLPPIHIGKLSLLLAILVWLAMLFVNLVRLVGILNQIDSGFAIEFSWVLQILFFLTVYGFYNYSITKNSQSDFLNLIWRGASTGLFAVAVYVIMDLFISSLGDSKLSRDPFLATFFYHIRFGLLTIFLVSTSLLWQHLILYQKTKQVVKQWQAFEIAMLVGMFLVFFGGKDTEYPFFFGMALLGILAVILSTNLKWIPYLTFKEKWKSLLFLAIIISTVCFFLWYTFSVEKDRIYPVNLTWNLFLISLFWFVLVYAVLSFLVTLFNLPTSSVFEQKLTEAINFQRLSQSIQPEENEEQVLDILMDSCMSAAYADAAWLEMNSEDFPEGLTQERFIDGDMREEISDLINDQKSVQAWASEKRPENISPITLRLHHPKFESVLLVPLVINKIVIGKIVLCKEVRDGFNKEMLNIISTFARQACIAVENHRLLNQAILHERYQEELKIAQRVQKSLLPTKLDHNQSFDICAYSNAADEVGGDYYDTYMLDEDRYVLIIGDVSGKGTSAAFHMSQMKGIFQSLIQLNISPSDFMIKANAAVSKCLERNHFITASIFIINTAQQTICHSRAGHVPTLFHQVNEHKSAYLEIDGLGLGILRNMQYKNHVVEKTFTYKPGDVLVLFTDGIVEAKNDTSDQFGYDRIKTLLDLYHDLNPQEIQSKIIDSLHNFVGGERLIDDDYSMMVVKFSQSTIQI